MRSLPFPDSWSQDWLRVAVLVGGFFLAWTFGGWVGGFRGGLGLVQLALLGGVFGLTLVFFAPHWTAFLAILLLPFYNISPFLSYQTFLVVGALAVAWTQSASHREPWLADTDLSGTDVLVMAYFGANLLALAHGYVRLDFDPELSRAISRTFSDAMTGVLGYWLVRFWATRRKLPPRRLTSLITWSLVGLAAILLMYLVRNGFDLSFFQRSTVSGTHLRQEIYEYGGGADLLTRAAVEPGGSNLKTMAFLVGIGLTLPHIFGQKASSGYRLTAFAKAQLFALCVALLFSRSGFGTMILLGAAAVWLSSERKSVALTVGVLTVASVVVVNVLSGFLQVTTLANFAMQGFDPGDRLVYASELLWYLLGAGGIFFGMGFDVAAHTFQISEFHLSSFNTHNDLLWVLANGGIVTLVIFLTLAFRLGTLGFRLRESRSRELRIFGSQVILVLLAVGIVSMFHLHGIFAQYAVWPWLLLGVAETYGGSDTALEAPY